MILLDHGTRPSVHEYCRQNSPFSLGKRRSAQASALLSDSARVPSAGRAPPSSSAQVHAHVTVTPDSTQPDGNAADAEPRLGRESSRSTKLQASDVPPEESRGASFPGRRGEPARRLLKRLPQTREFSGPVANSEHRTEQKHGGDHGADPDAPRCKAEYTGSIPSSPLSDGLSPQLLSREAGGFSVQATSFPAQREGSLDDARGGDANDCEGSSKNLGGTVNTISRMADLRTVRPEARVVPAHTREEGRFAGNFRVGRPAPQSAALLAVAALAGCGASSQTQTSSAGPNKIATAEWSSLAAGQLYYRSVGGGEA
jgi:hypothetical protein